MASRKVTTIQRLGIGRFQCTHMSTVVCNEVGTTGFGSHVHVHSVHVLSTIIEFLILQY